MISVHGWRVGDAWGEATRLCISPDPCRRTKTVVEVWRVRIRLARNRRHFYNTPTNNTIIITISGCGVRSRVCVTMTSKGVRGWTGWGWVKGHTLLIQKAPAIRVYIYIYIHECIRKPVLYRYTVVRIIRTVYTRGREF